MYIIRKGENSRISLPDKESATELIYALTVMGCSESFHTQHIIGHKENEDVFEVCFFRQGNQGAWAERRGNGAELDADTRLQEGKH